MQVMKKPVAVEAIQWFKMGDHPEVKSYKDRPGYEANVECGHCNKKYSEHGYIQTLEGGHIVCPSDWIIKGVEDEYYPCKDRILKKTYVSCEDKPFIRVERNDKIGCYVINFYKDKKDEPLFVTVSSTYKDIAERLELFAGKDVLCL